MAHTCDAIVLSCMDFRIQKFVEDWARKNIGERNYDRISTAGASLDLDFVLRMVELSTRLHHIKRVILINHDDCGAYGASGTKEKHAQDLKIAKEKIQKLYSKLNVETYFMYLDGKIEKVK